MYYKPIIYIITQSLLHQDLICFLLIRLLTIFENYTKEELRKVQLEDEIVGKVLRWLELGWKPQPDEL